MMRKKIFIISSVVLVCLIAVSFFYFKKEKFEIIHPHRGEITESVYSLGKIKSNKKFDLIIGVVLKIKKVFAYEGDRVRKGDPLIQFDNLIINSPLDGTVTYLKYQEGETALPQIPVLRVENLNDLYLELSLEQQSALRIKNGQKAKISFESLRGMILAGSVMHIFPRNDEFIATVFVKNLPSNVLPGMTADVSIEIGRIAKAMLVPLASVQNGLINLKRKDKWIKKKVEVGHVNSLFVELRDKDISTKDQIRFIKKD
jgi:multidrug efflux pump subunit AcrA (membrane-fusion protein)